MTLDTKVDVFFTTLGSGGLRGLMANLCLARWREEPGIRLHVLLPDGSPETFQRFRRIEADELALSNPYIVADDDCLLPDTPTAEQAVATARDYPDFGQLSWWPSNSTLRPWNPGETERGRICVGGRVFSDDRVMEHVSVGGICLRRQGLLDEWPPPDKPTPNRYDSVHASALRALGYRSGYFRELLMNHLGRGPGYSEVCQ